MLNVQNQAIMIKNSEKLHNICEIKWNCIPHDEWDDIFNSVKRANLLQSTQYARAMAGLNNQNIRYGVININGVKAGLVIMLEAGILKNAIHGVIIDRAPIWLEGYGSLADFELFLSVLSAEFPKRLGRKIRFIPEMEKSAQANKLLEEYGYKLTSNHGYQTIWLDIRPNLETLRKNLNAKWRNKLNKSEKHGMEIVFSDEGDNYPWLIQRYAVDKAMRKYDGPSVKTINALAGEFSRGKNMLIGYALLEGEVIAAILIFNHGTSATYQIGYNSEIGRDKCAHHLLLWQAISALKERNINDFDLGGINDESAKGVKIFKSGLSGRMFETLGLYR